MQNYSPQKDVDLISVLHEKKKMNWKTDINLSTMKRSNQYSLKRMIQWLNYQISIILMLFFGFGMIERVNANPSFPEEED